MRAASDSGLPSRRLRTLQIVARAFLLLAPLLLGGAGVAAIVEAGAGRDDVAEGTVVAPGYATVRFMTPDGRQHSFQSGMKNFHLRVGDRVPVAYDPANPANARIGGILGRWALVTIFAGLAAAFAGIGALLTTAGRSLRSRAISR